MVGPTKKQLLIIDQIEKHIANHKYSPTVRELAAVVGMSSSSTMHAHLSSMLKKGLIEWEPTRPRTLKVLKKDNVSKNHSLGS
ncbi:transcriptional regulator [Cohnella endophytica]|uniref:Transcriptional regulator n=1 Tax=Cohnella endophytica TaxID=2419778 RepID=A0A494Y0S3_9BACL|nr:transcriptional regulator [Cohnella endophytica]